MMEEKDTNKDIETVEDEKVTTEPVEEEVEVEAEAAETEIAKDDVAAEKVEENEEASADKQNQNIIEKLGRVSFMLNRLQHNGFGTGLKRGMKSRRGMSNAGCDTQNNGQVVAGPLRGQNRILALLSVSDALTQKQIAYLLGIRAQSVSEAVAKLEERALVERKRDENDKRVFVVKLTDEGSKVAEQVAHAHQEGTDAILNVLTDEEKVQFENILEKLNGAIEEMVPKECIASAEHAAEGDGQGGAYRYGARKSGTGAKSGQGKRDNKKGMGQGRSKGRGTGTGRSAGKGAGQGRGTGKGAGRGQRQVSAANFSQMQGSRRGGGQGQGGQRGMGKGMGRSQGGMQGVSSALGSAMNSDLTRAVGRGMAKKAGASIGTLAGLGLGVGGSMLRKKGRGSNQ